MRLTLNDLESNDILLDADGDMFVLDVTVVPGASVLRCLTDPYRSMVRRSDLVDIELPLDWIWHNRYGCLLDG